MSSGKSVKEQIHRSLQRLLGWFGARANINFLDLAYDQLGILKYQDAQTSGEEFFLGTWLPKLLNKQDPVVFDVGANVGDYLELVKRFFPRAQCYAFEPSSAACETIRARFSANDVKLHRVALGPTAGTATLYNYRGRPGSSHGSLHRGVFEEIHGATDLVEEETPIVTVDEFCKASGIKRIDLLKIDTEGTEFDVLLGAVEMIKSGAVDVVQFEFNEMNLISRVFLRDYFSFLPKYRFFRLNTNGLIALGAYDPRNEIFKFQNIVAVRDELCP